MSIPAGQPTQRSPRGVIGERSKGSFPRWVVTPLCGSAGEARAAALGIEAKFGERFPSILPGHEGHEAWLHPMQLKGGTVAGYRCSCPSSTSYDLPRVRAFRAYGRVCSLSRPLAARWQERLDYEAGLLEPEPTPELPELSETGRLVGEGLRLFLGLRRGPRSRGGSAWTQDAPFTFSRAFVMAWCQVTSDQAWRGMNELETTGYIVRTGRHHDRAIAWQVSPVAITAGKAAVYNLDARRRP
jgi:hypothetical protein